MLKNKSSFAGYLAVTSLALGLVNTGYVFADSNKKQQSNKTVVMKNDGKRVEYFGRAVDTLIYDYMEANDIPSISLAIVQAPYLPRVVGYGHTDINKQTLSSVNSMYDIGQMAHTFTMVAVMQTIEEGLINLEDKIGTHLSSLPKAWHDLTVKQLLQNSTGLADYTKAKGFNHTAKVKPMNLINLVKNEKMHFKPGTDAKISSTNSLILAMLVEKVTGMDFREHVKKNQIERLGLKSTGFVNDLGNFHHQFADTKNYKKREGFGKKFLHDERYISPSEPATGYSEKDGKLVETKHNSYEAFMGSGAIWASAQDISIWDIGLAGRMLIKTDEAHKFIFSPATLDNGKTIPAMSNWNFTKHTGFTDTEGHVPGFSSYLARFTNFHDLVCVTILANKEDVDLVNLGRKVSIAFNPDFGNHMNDKELESQESAFGVKETVARLEAELKKRNVEIFAKIDHSQNAKKVKQELKPNTVIVFGNPNAGTALMQANPAISNELPLRINVWEDERGRTWIGYQNMESLAHSYNLPKDHERVKHINKVLAKIVSEVMYQN